MVYTKRIDYNNSSQSASGSTNASTRLNSGSSSTNSIAVTGGAAGFDSFKSKLRNNLQGVKKQTKNQGAGEEEGNESQAKFNIAKRVGGAVHYYTEDVRKVDLCPGFI